MAMGPYSSLSTHPDASERPGPSDRDLILDAIQHYFAAGDTGSSTELRQAFHPGAMMFWVAADGALDSRSQSQWCEILDKAATPIRALLAVAASAQQV